LTLALQSATPGSTEATNLETAISALRLQMFSDQADYDVDRQVSRRSLLVNQSTAILDWGHQLVTTSSSPTLAECLRQSPSAVIGMATNLASYGGSFLPGILGAAVSFVGQLISTGLELLREDQYDKTKFASQRNEMPDSLNCALESMTELYCQATDSYTLLDLARRNRLVRYEASPLWKGIDVIDRQLPSLLQWLNEIQNEVPPQDLYQAEKQSAVLKEFYLLNKQSKFAQARINDGLEQARVAGSPDAKQNVLVNAITDLALELAGPSSFSGGSSSSEKSPFSAYNSDSVVWACWLVLGDIDPSTCPAGPSGTFGSVSKAELAKYIQYTLHLDAQSPATGPLLNNNWNTFVGKVTVHRQFGFQTNDCHQCRRDSRERASAIERQPGFSLRCFGKHLALHPRPHQLWLEQSTFKNDAGSRKAMVDEALRQLTAPDSQVCPATTSSRECQVSRITAIFDLFGLRNGSHGFLEDMKALVNIDIQTRFSNGEIPKTAADILKASGEDLFIKLQTAGSLDLDPMASDLATARADIEENVQVFRQFFLPAFQASVRREYNFANQESMSDGPNRPHGQRLAQLCMYWLITGNIPNSSDETRANWPDAETRNMCLSTRYFNANVNPDLQPSAPETPAFRLEALNGKIGGAPFAKRVCTLHKFKIQNRANTLYMTVRPLGRSAPH